MNQIVDSRYVPIDDVQRLSHEADDDAANWLNNMATTAFVK